MIKINQSPEAEDIIYRTVVNVVPAFPNGQEIAQFEVINISQDTTEKNSMNIGVVK